MTTSKSGRTCVRLLVLFAMLGMGGCAVTVSVGDAAGEVGDARTGSDMPIGADVPTRDAPADAARGGDTPGTAPDARVTPPGPCDSCRAGALCCGGACVDPSTDRSNCGACGRTCDDRHYCRADPSGALCAPALAPRLISPLSTATVTSRRPTLRWEPRAGGPRFLVEVCLDRSCAETVTAFEVAGDRGAPGRDLPPGRLYWRVSNLALGLRSDAWQLTVGARTAPVDTSWGSVTDYNGDGYADLAVGADQVAIGGQRGVGRVHLYYGSASGLPASPSRTFDGPDGAESRFGRTVETVGDLNGDGYVDLAVGAWSADVGGTFAAGRVHVYWGGAEGVSTARGQALEGVNAPVASFGYAIAGIGDVNGDGYGDLAVGAPGAPSVRGSWNAGLVTVFLGGAEGLSSARSTTLVGPAGPDGHFGYTVESAGDVNGDGFADLAVSMIGDTASGAWGPGRVQLYLGSAVGIVETPAWRVADPTTSQGFFGASVANVGDVNGDGYSDLAVGAPGTGISYGTAFPGHVDVYFGGAAGLPSRASQTFGDGGARHDFGYAVASLGDVDHNGYADLVVSERSGQPWTNGRLHFFGGGRDGLAVMAPTSVPAPFGSPEVRADDVNGDGFVDLLLGAPNSGTNLEYMSGDAFLWLGSASGFPGEPSRILQGPDGRSSNFGVAVAMLTGTHRRRSWTGG